MSIAGETLRICATANRRGKVPESFQRTDTDLQVKRIILATDFLESSRLALDYAVAFAHHFGARLTIMHSVELSHEAQEAEIISLRASVSRTNARTRLEAFSSGVRRLGIDVETDLREGEPCAALLDAVAGHKCDLLVLGTHGIYRGLQHLVIGSNAEKVLLSTRCPTLTVGRHVMGGIDLDLKLSDILFISELAGESNRSAWYASQLGQSFGVPVEVMHIRTDDPVRDCELCRRLADECRDTSTNDGSAMPPQWCSAQYHIERLFDPEEIVKRAEGSVSSLIVSGVHRTSRIDRHLHASFAFELAAKAACPVLSVMSND